MLACPVGILQEGKKMKDAEILITRRLEYLTSAETLAWEKIAQTYRTTWKNLVFEIEDSGQNWLVINNTSGQSLGLIMDFGTYRTVEQLLNTIKYIEANAGKPRLVDTRTSVLGTVLDVLNQEA